MIRFSEKNPVLLGGLGLVVITIVLGLALNTDKLVNLTGSGYSALFGEAGGLKDGDPVKVGGFEIGRVTDVVLDGPDVRVDFRVTDRRVRLGQDTSASVSVATILGEKFLKLVPGGDDELSSATPIPRTRTTAPYDLPDALSTLTTKSEAIDLPELASALNTTATTLDGTAPQLKAALDGVKRLSQTISSRDQSLRELLNHTNGVTGVLAQRAQQLKLLIGDGNVLLAELQARREAITQLLANASALAHQLNGLVADNRTQLGPMLDRLNSVLAVLKQNEDNIAKILKGAGHFATSMGDALATGPFFQAYVENLIPGNLIPLSDYLPQVPSTPAPGGTR
ncbi:MCE family protein [Pseudonocardia sp. T1-2H]|uniref:MCE family protein n=1 Tax=Pseudonocardia sp. T1-2H TaxID=3128899 RepID=UPI00310122ED